MAIRITSVTLSTDTYKDQEGRFHLINPFSFHPVDVKLREQMVAAGKKRVGLPVPLINVFLWGGREGDTFTLSGNVTSPNGREVGSLHEDSFTWHIAPFYLASIQPDGQMSFEESGEYTIKIDLDLIPRVKVPFFVYWEDESAPP